MDTSRWPTPDTSDYSDGERQRHDRRKEAVLQYIAGASFAEIRERTGSCASEVRRFVKRCVAPNGKGGIRGWTALVAGSRVAPYTRVKPVTDNRVRRGRGGSSGAVGALLERFPDLLKFIRDQI